MIGTKELCALLLAGSMGATSVVVVQKAQRPAAKSRPAVKAAAAKPKVQKSVQRTAERVSITECPSMPALQLAPFQVPTQEPQALLVDGGPGLALGPQVVAVGSGRWPSPAAPIPQPPVWAQMIVGFGLVGLACRRPRKAAA